MSEPKISGHTIGFAVILGLMAKIGIITQDSAWRASKSIDTILSILVVLLITFTTFAAVIEVML